MLAPRITNPPLHDDAISAAPLSTFPAHISVENDGSSSDGSICLENVRVSPIQTREGKRNGRKGRKEGKKEGKKEGRQEGNCYESGRKTTRWEEGKRKENGRNKGEGQVEKGST